MAGGRDLTRPTKAGGMPAGMPNPGDQLREDPPAGPRVGGGKPKAPPPKDAEYDEHHPKSKDYDEQHNDELEGSVEEPVDGKQDDKQRVAHEHAAPATGHELPSEERNPRKAANAFSRCLLAIVFGAFVGAAIAGLGEWKLYPAAAMTAIFAVIGGLIYGTWLATRQQGEY